jgi:hypothetical protein
MIARLGLDWVKRFTLRPMVGVEFVATMVEGQLEWYKKLQETTWTMISEAFSEKVITPGEASTEVCSLSPLRVPKFQATRNGKI